MLLKCCQDEMIHLVDRPVLRLHLRHRHPGYRLQRPPLPACIKVKFIFDLDCLSNRFVSRIGCPALHPFAQVLDLFLPERGLGRHLLVVRITLHRPDEETLLRFSGHDDLSALTALHPASPAVKQETPLDLLGRCGVTLVTVICQERPDPLFEESQVLARNRIRGCQMRQQHQGRDNCEKAKHHDSMQTHHTASAGKLHGEVSIITPGSTGDSSAWQ